MIRAVLLFAVCFFLSCANDPPRAAQVSGWKQIANSLASQPKKPLPPAKRLLAGRLKNGLSFYVLPNKRPQKTVVLRFVVRAGAADEQESQHGYAHFLEHMAFNGTKAFAKNQLIAKLETLGMTFGADINAHTAHDETIYKLSVPADQPEKLQVALQIFREWATNITLDQADVEAEKGVVLGELRAGQGFQKRALHALYKTLWPKSPYARTVIGTEASLRAATAASLRKYYNDWYTPDNMAVVVVGDVDATATKKAIAGLFSDVPVATNKPRRRDRRGGAAQRTIKYIDPVLPMSGVVRIAARERLRFDTFAAWHQFMPRALASMVLQMRTEDAAADKANYLAMAAAEDNLPGLHHTAIAAQYCLWSTSNAEDGLIDCEKERRRIREFGVSETELALAKEKVQKVFEDAADAYQAQQSSSTELADELAQVFLGESVFVDPRLQAALFVESARTTSRQTVVKALVSLTHDSAATTIRFGRDERAALTDASFAQALAKASAAPIHPYVAYDLSKPILMKQPQPAAITAKQAGQGGFSVWKLENGATVYFKRTSHKAKRVHMMVLGKGGKNVLPVEKLRSAGALAAAVGIKSKFGNFSRRALDRKLQDQGLDFAAIISTEYQLLAGNVDADSLEALLSVVYATFTQLSLDEAVAARLRDARIRQVQDNWISAQRQTQIALRRAKRNPRDKLLTPDNVSEIDVRESFLFFRQLFSGAGGYTFVIVGDVDAADLQPLVEKYLASIPQGSAISVDKLPIIPVTPQTLRVKNTEQSGYLTMHWRSNSPMTWQEAQRLKLTAAAIQRTLLQKYREKMGETYSVSVRSGYAVNPPVVTLTIRTEVDPKNTAKIAKQIKQDIIRLRRKGFGAAVVEQTRNTFAESFRKSKPTNRKELGVVMDHILYGYPLEQIQVKRVIDAWDNAMAVETMKKFISPQQLIVVTTVP